jgi:hypothetical protein
MVVPIASKINGKIKNNLSRFYSVAQRFGLSTDSSSMANIPSSTKLGKYF